MGSSSADVLATIAATGLALGVDLPPGVVATIAVSVEPTDGVMFPGIALVDHREARIAETLGPPPPMEIVALDFGGTVDTLEFNRVDRRAAWRSIEAETTEALRLVRLGVNGGDPALIGQGGYHQRQGQPGHLAQAHVSGGIGVRPGHWCGGGGCGPQRHYHRRAPRRQGAAGPVRFPPGPPYLPGGRGGPPFPVAGRWAPAGAWLKKRVSTPSASTGGGLLVPPGKSGMG